MGKLKLPKNVEEKEFLDTLEKAVADATRNFTIAYYEVEDLKQEARTFALEAISSFSSKKGSLYTFLRTHIHNRLINLKRDIEFRPQAPCHFCSNHDIDTSPLEQTGCLVYSDRSECVRWRRWMKTNLSKRTLSNPSSSKDDSNFNNTDDDLVLDDVLKRELKGLISHQIPNSMRGDYLKMMDGIHIPIKRRIKLLETIKKILLNGEN